MDLSLLGSGPCGGHFSPLYLRTPGTRTCMKAEPANATTQRAGSEGEGGTRAEASS